MCGIAGFYTPQSQSLASAIAMGERMAHRGPDDHGEWIQDGLHLVHRRLSIVDLSQGHQPMEHESGSTVVFNGEIYNHRELREQVSSASSFKTECDTEVLLHGYRHWGKKLPTFLNGMFAFAIFDPEQQELFLARDRLGQKPLYYTQNGDKFAFSSEIPSLLELDWVDRTLDMNALGQYFAHEHVPCPKTPFASILKCPPGHHITFKLKTGELTLERWWKPSFIINPEFEDPRCAAEAFEEKWNRALKYRMMADVPLGVFLSGGMDSSSCIAQLQHLYPEKTLQSFSIGFENKSFDESSYAQLVSEHVSSEHFPAQLDPQAMLDILPSIEQHMLDPIADASIIPTTLLCAHARKKVTVAIGGDGADELLCGYPPFHAHRTLGNMAWPSPIVRALQKCAELIPTNMDNLSFDFKVKQTLKGLRYNNPIRNEVWLGAGDPSFIQQLFHGSSEPWQPQQLYQQDLELWNNSDGPSLLAKVQELYLGGYMNDGILTKVDRASMFNSLEVRSPFLDVHLVEFFNSLPMHHKIKGSKDKIILRDVMAPRLPAQISQRPKKGFGMPIAHWFRADLKDMLWQRIQSAPDIFNRSFLEKLFNEHQEGSADHRKPLFTFFMLDPVLKAGRLP